MQLKKEITMAPKKSWNLKKMILTALFLVLLVVIFALLGGGDLLRDAGSWIGGLGSKADSMKGKIEEGATSVEKEVKKVKDAVVSGEKKVKKVKDAVTSEDDK
jgi:Sec-independent protein translocase protein TatA